MATGFNASMSSLEDEAIGVFYVAKCGSHSNRSNRKPVQLNFDEDVPMQSKNTSPTDCFMPAFDFRVEQDESSDVEEEEEAIASLNSRTGSTNLTAERKCNCFDPNCKLRSYFNSHSRQASPNGLGRTDDPDHPHSRLHSDDQVEGLHKAHLDLLRASGGAQEALVVYECCKGLYERQPQQILSTLASAHGDTVLMQLCSRPVRDQAPGSRRLLLGQIAAFARLYLEHKPELLFVRNRQGVNALELAAISDKAEAAVYLALLYVAKGRDVNEVNAVGGGHSVLHLLARKGDDCADALEGLLELKNSDGQRLLKYDVVNDGRKTPLDVALACTELFSTGKERTLYTKTIKLFLDAVAEDAEAMEMTMTKE